MFHDFCGRLRVPSTDVEHARARMPLAIAQLREAYQKQGLKDAIVAVDMTATHHWPIQGTFRAAGCDNRRVGKLVSAGSQSRKSTRAPSLRSGTEG